MIQAKKVLLQGLSVLLSYTRSLFRAVAEGAMLENVRENDR